MDKTDRMYVKTGLRYLRSFLEYVKEGGDDLPTGLPPGTVKNHIEAVSRLILDLPARAVPFTDLDCGDTVWIFPQTVEEHRLAREWFRQAWMSDAERKHKSVRSHFKDGLVHFTVFSYSWDRQDNNRFVLTVYGRYDPAKAQQ